MICRLALVVLLLHHPLSAQVFSEYDRDTIADRLAEYAQQIQNFEVRYNQKSIRALDVNEILLIAGRPGATVDDVMDAEISRSMLYRAGGERGYYKVVHPHHDGKDFVEEIEVSYDGSEWRHLISTSEVGSIPRAGVDPNRTTLSRPPDAWERSFLIPEGGYANYGELLRQADPESVVIEGDAEPGVLRVSFEAPWSPDGMVFEYKLRLDTSRGFTPVTNELWRQGRLQSRWSVVKMARIDGIHFPTVLNYETFVMGLPGIDEAAPQELIGAVKVREEMEVVHFEPNANFTSDDYTVDFPPHALVLRYGSL